MSNTKLAQRGASDCESLVDVVQVAPECNRWRVRRCQSLLYVRRASKGGNVNNLIFVLTGVIQKTTSSATGLSFQEIDEAGTKSYRLTREVGVDFQRSRRVETGIR